MTWKINVFAHTVIIQDTQWYNGRAHTYADYAVTDVLRMMGRAGRITLDEEGNPNRKYTFFLLNIQRM